MGNSVNSVVDGSVDGIDPSTTELGVVLRLRDCRPSRPLVLLFPTGGGILSRSKNLYR